MAQVHPGQPEYSQDNKQQPVTQQPAQTVIITGGMGQQMTPPRPWSSDLCDCCDDPKSCLLVCFCQECYGCHLASKAGESCCLPLMVPGWLIAVRAHFRAKHNIEGSIMDDCSAVCSCLPFVMCQLSREIDSINNGIARY